jgi:hypothetical protein
MGPENEQGKPEDKPKEEEKDGCAECPIKSICDERGDCPAEKEKNTPAGKLAAEIRERFRPTLIELGKFIEEKRKELPDLKLGFLYDVAIIDDDGQDHGIQGVNAIGVMKQSAANDVLRDDQGFLALAVRSLKAAKDYFGGRGSFPGMPPIGMLAGLVSALERDAKKSKADKKDMN